MKGQRSTLKWLYAVAVFNTVVLAGWAAIFEIPRVITLFWPSSAPKIEILFGAEGFLLVSFLIVMAPLVFLIRRPMWWGKLLLPVYGLSWVGHAAVLPFVVSVSGPHIIGMWFPAACGFVMFALAVAHQVVDPGFSRRSSTVPDA